MTPLELVALAASTSLLAGWRLYLVTLITGLGMKFGWVALPDQLQALDVLANNWVLAAAAVAVSGAIGVYHAGVELKIFEGVTTCTTAVRAGSNTELLEKLMRVPLIRCDQVQFRFLGISMAGWNAILSLGGAALILILNLRGRRA